MRYANSASEAAARGSAMEAMGKKEEAKKKWTEAKLAQSMAIVFFMGDLQPAGPLQRNHYKEYIHNIEFILNYIKGLNEPSQVFLFLLNFMPRLKKEKSLR